MRRSTVVTLTILAAVTTSGVAAYMLSGSDTDSTDYVVTDEASCVSRYGSDAQSDCQQTMRQAQQQHLASAPRFATVEACREATGGECETTPANRPGDKSLLTAGAVAGAVAVPVLAGVLIGRMMDNGQGRVTTPLYAGRPPAECQPGVPQVPGASPCAPRGSSSSSSSSSGSRFYYYSGSSYAGSSASVTQGRSTNFTASPDMARTISSGTASTGMGRVSTALVSRGGFGASARGYSSSSS